MRNDPQSYLKRNIKEERNGISANFAVITI